MNSSSFRKQRTSGRGGNSNHKGGQSSSLKGLENFSTSPILQLSSHMVVDDPSDICDLSVSTPHHPSGHPSGHHDPSAAGGVPLHLHEQHHQHHRPGHHHHPVLGELDLEDPDRLHEEDDDDEDEDSNSESISLSKCSFHESDGVHVPELARNDTVNRWKTFVMLLLLINAGVVTISTFEVMRQQEEKEFELAFNTAARTLIDASHYHAHSLVDTMQNFGESVTSYALDTEVTWPLITIPHFERRASLLRHASFLNMLGLVPLVPAQYKKDWEQYSIEHQYWIQDSYETLAKLPYRIHTTNDHDKHSISSSSTSSVHDAHHHHPDGYAVHDPHHHYKNDQALMMDYQYVNYTIPPTIHTFGNSHDNDNDNDNHISSSTNTSSSGEGVGEEAQQQRLYAPLWQLSPPPPPRAIKAINSDFLANQSSFMYKLVQSMLESQFLTISEALYVELYNDGAVLPHLLQGDGEEVILDINSTNTTSSSSSYSTPQSFIMYPIYDSFDDDDDEESLRDSNKNVGAFALGLLPWEKYFSDLLPDEISCIMGVLENSCGQVMSFAIDGPNATFLAAEDLHDIRFETLMVDTNFTEFIKLSPSLFPQQQQQQQGYHHSSNFTTNQDTEEEQQQQQQCHYRLLIYPTLEFRLAYSSSKPEYFALGLACLFIVTGVAFFIFVYVSRHRQRKVMAVAVSSSAIVASMFPPTVRDRILQDAEEEAYRIIDADKQELQGVTVDGCNGMILHQHPLRYHNHGSSSIMASLRSTDGSNILSNDRPRSTPIADVFPDVTIMFADIVGFTAWSSVREPHQVFELLETIYRAFDEIAKRRRVYKVETIGDCYVACAGLPTPRQDHALVMSRFARECFSALDVLVKQLERSLGPDTGELTMRFGLHSGPCTAGVLRGDRARYQLFGETVKMAARMESSSEPGHIQISQETAELLAAAKKSSWFIPTNQKVKARGKGEVQTYWLHPKRDEQELKNEEETSDAGSVTHPWLDIPDNMYSPLGANEALRVSLSEQNQRLAEWNANQLLKLLNQVVKQRHGKFVEYPVLDHEEGQGMVENAHLRWTGKNVIVIDEVKDCIRMAAFDPDFSPRGMENDMSALKDEVIQQLYDYVSIICSMYNNSNPYTNYQHASHVTMNVVKLLSRIVTPCRNNNRDDEMEHDVSKQFELYDKSLGIAADPMAQFAVAFAALIQDVDHPGVTNKQLVREGSGLAKKYNYVSITEQNSFTVAWDLLMDPMFSALRTTIYTNREEFDHFREILVNAVMATDLFNEEANEARNRRWERAFHVDYTRSNSTEEVTPETIRSSTRTSSRSTCSSDSSKNKLQLDRKATLVIEYIMQASDISNLMQHWHVYRKWSERQFRERCRAYHQGRHTENPSQTWYQGQLDVFDSIAIPLAKKLKEAGVFGSYSDDYLNQVKKNREEWFRKGTSIVQTMEKNFAEKHNDKIPRTNSRLKIEALADPNTEPSTHSHRIRRSLSADSIVWDQQNRTGVARRRRSNDGAPVAPLRSSTTDMADLNRTVEHMFSALPDFRRSRSDGAPALPGRSNDVVDLTEASRAVQEMFDTMPARWQKHSDDAPRTPRRSRDSVEMAGIAKQAAEELFADQQLPDQIIAPSLSKDHFVEMAAAIDEATGSTGEPSKSVSNKLQLHSRTADPSVVSETSLTTALDTSLSTFMSTSLNSQSVETQPLRNSGISKADKSPKTPTRRRAQDDESAGYTMELIPETSTSSTASSSKPVTSKVLPDDVSILDQDESIISDMMVESRTQKPDRSVVSDYDDASRGRVDPSVASDINSVNDESTLMTLGRLWTSSHQRDCASQADDSTIFSMGPNPK